MDIQQALTDAVEAALPAPTPTPAPEPAPQSPADAVPTPEAPETEPTDTPDEVPEAEAEAEVEAETEAEAEDTALPDGYVAVPVVEDKLATEFVLRDAEGEVEIPALIVEYKANGKVRQDRLDQVVKLAQFGVYNQEREEKVRSAEQEAVQLKQERERLTQLIDEREAQLERILSDEDFFLSVREAYQQENSPEKRAERAEREIQNLKVQSQMAEISRQGQVFYDGEVQPAIQLIANALPTVTPAELEERMAYAMQLHAKTGPNGQPYLPASQFEAARQYIVNDLAIWAQMTHARRSETAPSPQVKEAQAAAAKAQVEAQKAKRAVGQATKPVGRAASNAPAKPKAAKPATIDDAFDSAMSEVMSSIR
jgi:hypothetical protein